MSSRSRLQIAVFCSGNGSNLEALFQAESKGLLKAEIALVVCDRPEAFAIVRANRRKKPVFLAEYQYFKTREDYEKAVVGVLKKKRIGLVVLAGFMRILTPYFLKQYAGRVVNVHPSLLPAFKGAHAIRDAFQYGAKVTGVTVHLVTNELDGGPIILQEAVSIQPRETLKSLEARIHKVEHQLYPRAVRLIAEKRIKLSGRTIQIK